MSKEIKARVSQLNEELNRIITPGIFMLNGRVGEILDELESLQKRCKHNFINGICEFCEKEEDGE